MPARASSCQHHTATQRVLRSRSYLLNKIKLSVRKKDQTEFGTRSRQTKDYSSRARQQGPTVVLETYGRAFSSGGDRDKLVSDGTDSQLSAHKKRRGKERRKATRNLHRKPSDVDDEKLVAIGECQDGRAQWKDALPAHGRNCRVDIITNRLDKAANTALRTCRCAQS